MQHGGVGVLLDFSEYLVARFRPKIVMIQCLVETLHCHPLDKYALEHNGRLHDVANGHDGYHIRTEGSDNPIGSMRRCVDLAE